MSKCYRVIQEAKAELIKCGWRDEMLEIAKEAMASSSLEMTLEELIHILTKEGLESVPSSVKESILETMKNADGN